VSPMKLRMLPPLACIFFYTAALGAGIAVIPYKIENSSSDFPESTGAEYSRLLSVASLVMKDDAETVSPRHVNRELDRLKLSPQDVITKDDLDLMGKTLHADYFLLGNLSRGGDRYRSDSVLYSVRDRKVVARARVSDNELIGLAQKEVKEALRKFRSKSFKDTGTGGGAMDLVFLMDLSYRINRDWQPVKSAVIGLVSHLIDSRRMDTRVYLVPFSDKIKYSTSSASVNSIVAVRNDLDNLKPAGGAGKDDFSKSLRHAVNSVRWRADARKTIVVISNTPVSSGSADRLGVVARNKGIIINTISLGRMSGDESQELGRLAESTAGSRSHAAYHQKIFDPAGEAVELYMENGRIFRSRVPDKEWKKGLFSKEGSRRQQGKPKSFLEEVFISEKKGLPTPYDLPQVYSRITMDRVINQEQLESNVDLLVKRGMTAGKTRKGTRAVSAGKALISDGKISFWVSAPSEDFIKYFIDRQDAGLAFPLGVMVKKDVNSAYGVSLVPVIKGIGSDYLPQCLKASLSDIVRRGEYYSTSGLSFPPVWFVDVKVENSERSRGGSDIRGR
jgi:hypothetical protein